MQLQSEAEMEAAERRRREAEALRMKAMLAGAEPMAGESPNGEPDNGTRQGRRAAAKASTFVRSDRKVGRNEACPCGSGKKYKHCHGKVA